MKICGEDSCLEKCAKRIGLSNRGCYLLITGAAVMTFAILLIVITVTSSQTGIVRRFTLFYRRIPPPLINDNPDSGRNQCSTSGSKIGSKTRITAKFWYVSDFRGDPIVTADSYVAAMNEALSNSDVPILYEKFKSCPRRMTRWRCTSTSTQGLSTPWATT